MNQNQNDNYSSQDVRRIVLDRLKYHTDAIVGLRDRQIGLDRPYSDDVDRIIYALTEATESLVLVGDAAGLSSTEIGFAADLESALVDGLISNVRTG